jgi:hypothetical protein
MSCGSESESNSAKTPHNGQTIYLREKCLLEREAVWLALVAADVSEERIVSIKVKKRSRETSVLTRVTRRDIPEDGFLHSHCRENLKSRIFT